MFCCCCTISDILLQNHSLIDSVEEKVDRNRLSISEFFTRNQLVKETRYQGSKEKKEINFGSVNIIFFGQFLSRPFVVCAEI